MPLPHATRPVRLAAALLVLVSLTACASPPRIADDQYPFDMPAQATATAPTPAAAAAAAGNEPSADLVVRALNYLGVRYRRGGSDGDTGFDCSGFTRHVFESSLGLLLPRRADEQASAAGLQKVDRTELQPGDLVFFNTLRRTFSHVGIYIGDHKFVHAPRPGSEVRVEDMRFAYWTQRFTGARRALLAENSTRP
jgi:cell wall-associated NlpC family hydrolase